MSLPINVNQAMADIIRTIKVKLVPMLSGSPGIGKSDLIRQIADKFNLQVIDLRLAQCDPTDLLGFPHICQETKKASYMPMNTFPVEGDALPKGKDGWLLFLDEFNHADRSVQKAAYKLTLDRMVGDRKLHPNVAIVAAGNLSTDNALVEEMSTATQSRVIHLELAVDANLWIEWATKNKVDHRITSFIQYKPGNLHQFQPDHKDKTFPAPRTWEFLSRLISDIPEDQLSYNLLPLMAGTIGEGMAREFLGFTKVYKSLLTVEEILAAPNQVPVPDNPSAMYALTGSIADKATKDNMEKLHEFIVRLPAEFQMICMREIVRRKEQMFHLPVVQNWAIHNAKELL